MQQLAPEQFKSWLDNAEVIEKDRHGVKVLRLQDGSFLKLFRYKRLLSKNRLISPAKRFSRNATLLQALGIPCPEVIATYRLTEPSRSLVHYSPLAGDTLRQILRQPENATTELMQAIGAFIARLHDQGVYFRSLHLGNIIRTPDQQFGLIDISDLSGQKAALSRWQRQRNLKHLLRYDEDWRNLAPAALEQLTLGYDEASTGNAMRKAMQSFQLLK